MRLPHHQAVTAGLQGAETDAEQDRRGEGVVVDEASALGVSVVTVQGQVGVSVARKQYGAEVDLDGDGLNSAVHVDVPLTCRNRRSREQVRFGSNRALNLQMPTCQRNRSLQRVGNETH